MKKATRIAFVCLVLAFELVALVRWTTQQITTSSSSSMSLALDKGVANLPYVWNAQGCQQWAVPKKQHLTALVVTLLLQPALEIYTHVMRFNICNGSIASQLHHLVNPHGWDMLLIVAKERPSDPTWLTLDQVATCLELSGSSHSMNYTMQTWKNLDGTTLITRRYRNVSSNHTVFLAETQLHYPQYIQDNLTLLDFNIAAETCQRPSSYIQSTRWYTHEMLELGILQAYDYFAKIDTDVWFMRTIPFDILWDLQLQNAVLMHTAKFDGGVKCCSTGIVDAVQQFQQQEQASSTIDGWKGSMCSTGQVELQEDVDLYYANFLVGRVSFWQSPAVRAFGRFLTNNPAGFFMNQWSDQIFFHFAMGLFLGPNYTDHVADYTDLRCAPVENCWLSINNEKYLTQYERPRTCNNGGYFLHTKALEVEWNQASTDTNVVRKTVPRISTYEEKCDG